MLNVWIQTSQRTSQRVLELIYHAGTGMTSGRMST